MRTNLVAGISLVLFVGCGSEGVAPPPSSIGGQSSTGNETAQGGSTTSGGGNTSATGGASANGGTTAGETGGKSSSAGGSTAANSSAAGGASAATGGTKAAGGASAATGGTKAAGGASAATGGTKAAGGASATTGGSKATGGVSAATGGTNAAGGASAAATGGTKAAGGASAATGGTKAAGGTSAAGGAATGGATTAAGGAATFKCDNLSLAPSTTGTKPAGAVGGLKVLDWAGFKGAVSFTFDDNMTTGSYAKFKATGAHVTFFVTSAMSNASGYTGAPANGDEVGNHSTSHTQTGSVSDFQSMQATIQSSYGVTAYTGAAPYGDATWSTPAKSFFIADRGVSNGDISPRTATESLLFNLPAYIPGTGAASATMSAEIKSGKWKVFCVHGWASPAYNPINESDMITTMTKAVSDGYWAESMGHVTAYFIGQNAISASATTSATWSLPAHFPTNMCVRVTTTGGTVTQKGAEVPWDSHGYYQISLDAGEVTIK